MCLLLNIITLFISQCGIVLPVPDSSLWLCDHSCNQSSYKFTVFVDCLPPDLEIDQIFFLNFKRM